MIQVFILNFIKNTFIISFIKFKAGKACLPKHSLKPYLGLNENHLKVSLNFSYSSSDLKLLISTYSVITIQGLTNIKNFNISVLQTEKDENYYLQINTTNPIINRPKLKYCLYLPLEYITNFNLIIPYNCTSISLLDWYPLSESNKATIESAKQQSSVNSLLYSSGGSTFLLSNSGIFFFGLIMIDMIYFLKYINVKYPVNALSLFENKPSNYVLFFHYSFALEMDSQALPDIYTFYGVFPYFLNNAGEIICQIGVLLVFVFLIILLNLVLQKRCWIVSKLLSLLKELMVWDIVILFIFLSIQKIIFFISCSLNFFTNTSQGIFNSVIAISVLIILIIWLVSLFYHTKKCLIYRNNNKIFPSPELPLEKNNELNNINNYIEPNSAILDLTSSRIIKNQIQASSFSKDREAKSALVNKNESSEITFSPNNFKKNENTNNKKQITPTKTSNSVVRRWRWSLNKYDDSIIAPSFSPLEIEEKIQKKTNCFLRIFEVSDWINYISKYEILYEDLNCKNIWQKYFKLLFISKQAIISFLVPCLYNYPIPQMILIVLIYFVFFLATLLKNPFESRIIWTINVVSEMICFSSILSVMIIAFLDHFENEDYELKMKLGWVIIFANLSLFYWVMVTGVIQAIYHLILKYKQYKLNSKINPEII